MSMWAALITDLKDRGWTLREIGDAIGLSPGAVSDIKQGYTTAPNANAGVKLYELHSTGAIPTAETPEQKAAA